MPLQLNVGLSRKVGEANYGSRGASVNLELELESGLVQQPQKLQDRIRQLFTMARDAVEEELRPGSNHEAHGNNGSGNGHHSSPQATAAQVRALHAIANRQRINLQQLVREQFNAAEVEHLSLPEASKLIDQLKGQAASR